eukprot:SAG11_NODE_5958_length_1424_cov_8.135094_1_plen_185_part_00
MWAHAPFDPKQSAPRHERAQGTPRGAGGACERKKNRKSRAPSARTARAAHTGTHAAQGANTRSHTQSSAISTLGKLFKQTKSVRTHLGIPPAQRTPPALLCALNKGTASVSCKPDGRAANLPPRLLGVGARTARPEAVRPPARARPGHPTGCRRGLRAQKNRNSRAPSARTARLAHRLVAEKLA